MSQGARRQMASTSLRDLMSQVTTLLVSGFVKGSYPKPKGLTEGSFLAHSVIEKARCCAMKPIPPFKHLNYDMTSTYAFDGTSTHAPNLNKWAQGSSASQSRGARNKNSMWLDNKEMKFNGLNVKWCEGATASGHIMPMVSIFSGLSDKEMPDKPFIVVEVPGMCMNANIDDMKSFFEWYDDIISSYYREVLELHCQVSPQDDQGPQADASSEEDEKAQDVGPSSSV
eukprot:jgi/Psemu1/62401/gm1.62401_g